MKEDRQAKGVGWGESGRERGVRGKEWEGRRGERAGGKAKDWEGLSPSVYVAISTSDNPALPLEAGT